MTDQLVPEPISRHDSCVFLRVGQEIFRITERRLAHLGIRTRHFTVLAVLDHGGSQSQQALSAATRIDTSTMVAAIDELSTLKLVTRAKDQTDRRRSVIAITEAGAATLARANEVMGTVGDDVFADISPADRAQLTTILATLNAGLFDV
ncbi:MarR family transcriptional regulator [Gordonia sp. SID5947]|uniref:MarR family winged helix-turn-helix transcriptional regulator n=1 Tax=Gordonia sp. SID5947 TaxID=2690315 RepID=UPI00136C6179|nr:MarR family winged helix-turn-helix transcriptional regulator [Gordonia sp. SID5947]MYR08340.1 MarR family transcriptional regulator [Gordonia sp. SID5947]